MLIFAIILDIEKEVLKVLLNEAIKIRINKLMEQKNTEKEQYTRYKLSYDAGMNPSNLNDFYRDKITYPRIDTLFLICDALNISLKDFFDDDIFRDVEIKD